MTSAATVAPTTEVPAGYVQDRNGNLIPKDRVKPLDRERDKVVRKLIKDAKAVNEVIAEFKDKAMAAVADFGEHSAQAYGAKIGGQKGNITLFTFDGAFKIELAVNENRAFDERLQVAKSLIDECIHEWMKGSNKNIQALVQDAFKVDKQGKVSVERILGLRRLNIEDERWDRAMDAISDSIQITGSKRYIRVYQRDDASGEYNRISLDAASV
ncbi:MAG: sulfate transporter [Hoeflea sp.]|uniref:DUF3164 family protein n=1 Tax=Hoeflea sp. TaxID=1940281 RepID=UPI000C115961|nr:DUF3164 family protein [Hoeflea sp.]PHR19274.1 MAG: sulfate transporter [Hoeflea sp.]